MIHVCVLLRRFSHECEAALAFVAHVGDDESAWCQATGALRNTTGARITRIIFMPIRQAEVCFEWPKFILVSGHLRPEHISLAQRNREPNGEANGKMRPRAQHTLSLRTARAFQTSVGLGLAVDDVY